MLSRRNLFRLAVGTITAAATAPLIRHLPVSQKSVYRMSGAVVQEDFSAIAGKIMANAIEYKRDTSALTLLLSLPPERPSDLDILTLIDRPNFGNGGIGG